jgi:hypothetical protein
VHDTRAAIEFLQWWDPEGPWVLVAIVPDGKISAATFTPDTAEAMHNWIDARQGMENVYFHVNSTGDKHLTKKAVKEDIVEARWLHVDVDPTTDAELFEAERKRILKRIKEYAPAPTCIIDSGGGYQAFWRLADPVEMNGEPEDFERYNRQLEVDFNGDHCHNVDRIMRLPGTVNVPNKKKRKKGRKPAPARVIYQDDSSYELSAFMQAPAIGGQERGDSGRPSVDISGNLPVFSDIDELDEHGDLSAQMKMLIVQGHDPDNPDKYSSRSECIWAVMCAMVRGGFPDEIIAAVILDPDFGISGHILDQKNPEGYAVRQIQRAKEAAIDPKLVEMNDRYFVSMVGGKLKVVSFEMDPALKRRQIVTMGRDDFMAFYANQKIQIGTSKEGQPIEKRLGKWWFEHPQRRTYDNMVFYPGGNVPDTVYNLWQGFAVDAREGQGHERYLEHIRENICCGNEEWYDYVIKWMARVVQNPASQSETAIVLRGGQGTGKNTFVECFGALFPDHFMQVSNSKHLVGNFNSHLRDVLLLYGNEAFFAGDKSHEAVLKMLITENTMPIEGKGIDVKQAANYIHLVMGSNSDWVVPAGLDERRFFVLDVGDGRKQDARWFAQLKKEMRQGGYENLLHFLLGVDLTGWEIRNVPQTKALLDQKIRTMPRENQWWMDKLINGYVQTGHKNWPREIDCEAVWAMYAKDMHDQQERHPLTKVQFGRFFKKVCGPKLKRKQAYRGTERPYVYLLPSLEDCRDEFDQNFGGPYDWSDDGQLGQEGMPF